MGILLAGRAASVTLFSSPALCPQDSAWHVEENSEEEKRATGLPTAQIQVRWASAFSRRAVLFPKVSGLSPAILVFVFLTL